MENGSILPLAETKSPVRASSEQVVLNARAVVLCLQKAQRLSIAAERLNVFYVHGETAAEFDYSSGSLQCELHITSPPKTIFSVLLRDWRCSNHNYVTISDELRQRVANNCFLWLSPGLDFRTANNTVKILITVGNDRDPFSVTLDVRALPLPRKDRPVIRYVTPTFGYIQSMGFDPPSGVSGLQESLVTIPVKPGYPITLANHVFQPAFDRNIGRTLISSLRYHSRRPHLTDLVNKTPFIMRNRTLYVVCGIILMDFLPTKVSCSKYRSPGLGFRLLLTFHKESYQPQYVSRWPPVLNCSVPFWNDFKLPLACDFIKNCIGGEDEQDCPHTRCRHNGVIVDGICYAIIAHKSAFAWMNHRRSCRELGGYLASLNSPREWSKVSAFLATYSNELLQAKAGTMRSVGLRAASVLYPEKTMYSRLYLWDDGTLALYNEHKNIHVPSQCGYMQRNGLLETWGCFLQTRLAYNLLRSGWKRKHLVTRHYSFSVCELPTKAQEIKERRSPANVVFEELANSSLPVPYVACKSGHLTHAFLACDISTSCWSRQDGSRGREKGRRRVEEVVPDSTCPVDLPLPFACGSGGRLLPYSLVCDYRQDCPDNSDERFCVFPCCSPERHFQCTNGQCIPKHRQCDKMVHCMDSSDETDCDTSEDVIASAPRPGIIDFFGGSFVLREELSADQSCPTTHFRCPANGYCLPVYLRCNGVLDCRIDETACNSLACSGYYRCRGSYVCLHPDHVCDGWPQCPQHDDELFCDLSCPQGCNCYGLAYICSHTFTTDQHPHLRYLNAAGSGIQPLDLQNNTMLLDVSLARCDIPQIVSLNLPNLRFLDLSHNQLRIIQLNDFRFLKNLRSLLLTGNPMTELFPMNISYQAALKYMHTLDISTGNIKMIHPSVFASVPNLQILDMSNNSVDLEFLPNTFSSLKRLQVLDLRGLLMNVFPRDLLLGLNQLQELYADNLKLCCSVVLPAAFNLENCHAPFDELFSCDALLRSGVYRMFLALFTILSVLGNVLSFVIRLVPYGRTKKTGYNVFVTHLCVSDLLMGVYLIFIGVADFLYKGTYLWEDTAWRHSTACHIAGFLSILSSEVSALIICLITLDRFLVLRFPFSHFRFGIISAQVTVCVVWAGGMVLAGLPLLPSLSSWHFYSQTSICIPLPVTRRYFEGHNYAFGVMIILNFSLFILIAVGQVCIFVSFRASTFRTTDTSCTNYSQDFSVARRLFAIVISDFLCWFPVGLLGLLASQQVRISGEVNVAMAIFVLPLNSALNPFLYTMNTVGERRQRSKEERLLKILLAKHQPENRG